ncbi:M48 family metallopeptidase [Stenoxybacter acetivorans]|uniref:M48 family metallopeptidase n=1 Tax=Stenoxybacter acetivorans TaxID=422441 RepID=UPI00055C98B3|nr:M48 family metallopeptidase [Stenoxybacter acetivorans]
MPTSHTIYVLFLLFFVINTLGQLYLSFRQSRAVLAHRHAVPAAFMETVSPAEHQKGADYTLAKQGLARYEILFQAALLLIFTLGGGLNTLFLISQKITAQPIGQGVLLIGLFVLINGILSLPFDLYRHFRLEAQFGFNRMTLATFISDQIKGVLLTTVLGAPLLFAVIYLMGAAGNGWWLWVWGLWLGFSWLMMWAFPKWIAPLFNRFTPLADLDLKQRIEALLHRTGFHSNGIFVMDGSKRSGHGNAYFTGLGKNKRIVFFDTLIKDMLPEEVEAILAHELGHFAHKHIIKQMLLTSVLVLLVLAILGWLLPQAAFYQGLGVSHASYAMALLLFLLVLPLMIFPFSPLAGLLSRRNEFEADRFAAKYAHAQDLIRALTKLYRSNAASLVSDVWYSRFYDSHPPAHERIAALQVAIKSTST